MVKDVCMCIQVKRETGGCTGGCNSGVIEGEPKEKRNRDRTKRYRGHERERGREMDDRIDDDLLHRSIDRKKKDKEIPRTIGETKSCWLTDDPLILLTSWQSFVPLFLVDRLSSVGLVGRRDLSTMDR